jgi:epsilon-lactone hydrolase
MSCRPRGELLRKLLDDAGPSKVTVVGNSAGAALGLAAARWLRDSGYRQPNGLVLSSPGGDFSISRPEQIAIAARDPIDLAAKARAAGVPVELHLRRDQPHNYAGMPTPEGRQARAMILRAVAGTTTGVLR